MSKEHRVKVGHHEFIASHDYLTVYDRAQMRAIMDRRSAEYSDAIKAMMQQLDAARVVVQAARDAVDAPTLRRKAILQDALALHDRLTSDREPTSVWCGVEQVESGPQSADRDRAMFRAFMKMPTAATLDDLNDMRAEIDDSRLGPADRAEVKRVFEGRKAWLQMQAAPGGQP